MGKELSVAHSVKDLGVIVDKNLSFDEHINVLASDLINKLVMLSRIRHLFDQQSLFIIINSLIFTKLLYCSTVWSGTSKTNIHKLQLVHNFSARILSGKRKFEHIMPTLKNLVLMYKCMNNLAPDYLTCLRSALAYINITLEKATTLISLSVVLLRPKTLFPTEVFLFGIPFLVKS